MFGFCLFWHCHCGLKIRMVDLCIDLGAIAEIKRVIHERLSELDCLAICLFDKGDKLAKPLICSCKLGNYIPVWPGHLLFLEGEENNGMVHLPDLQMDLLHKS